MRDGKRERRMRERGIRERGKEGERGGSLIVFCLVKKETEQM